MFHSLRMSDSTLRKVITRLQEAISKPDFKHGPDIYEVRGYDVQVLFETIKRYGGRKDWTPDEKNIAQLALPVRYYIGQLRSEITRLQSELVRSGSQTRKAEAEVQRLRNPPR